MPIRWKAPITIERSIGKKVCSSPKFQPCRSAFIHPWSFTIWLVRQCKRKPVNSTAGICRQSGYCATVKCGQPSSFGWKLILQRKITKCQDRLLIARFMDRRSCFERSRIYHPPTCDPENDLISSTRAEIAHGSNFNSWQRLSMWPPRGWRQELREEGAGRPDR